MIDPDLVLAVVNNRADDNTLRDLAIQALAAQVTDERRRYEALAAQHAEAMTYLNEKDEEVNRLLEMLALASNEAAAYRRLHREQTANVAGLSAAAQRSIAQVSRWKRIALYQRRVASKWRKGVMPAHE